jgi:uncharacterized integral membrane protein
MRAVYLIILLLLLAALCIFAFQNRGDVTIHYLDRSLTCTMAVLVVAVYLVGMVTGWTVIGFMRRSIRRISERPRD